MSYFFRKSPCKNPVFPVQSDIERKHKKRGQILTPLLTRNDKNKIPKKGKRHD